LDLSKDFSRELHKRSGKGHGLPNGIVDAEKIGRLGNYDVLEPVVNGTSPSNAKKQNGQQTVAPAPTSQQEHNQQTPNKKRKRNTGAGDEIRLRERDSGVGQLIRRFKKPDGEDTQVFDVNEEHVHDDDDEMDLDDIPGGGGGDILALMRRGNDQGGPAPAVSEESTHESRTKTRAWTHWHTFEYNSILGISVIGPPSPATSPSTTDSLDATTPTEGHDQNLEVIIVERPIYDVEQTPRFDGGQDWDV